MTFSRPAFFFWPGLWRSESMAERLDSVLLARAGPSGIGTEMVGDLRKSCCRTVQLLLSGECRA